MNTRLEPDSSPDTWRRFLALGTRTEKLAVLTWMEASDRWEGEERFRADVIRATEDPDFIVAMQATYFALGYYNSELFPQRFSAAPDIGFRALEYYMKYGNYSESGYHGHSFFVPMFSVGLSIVAKEPDDGDLDRLELMAECLKENLDTGYALQVGLVLAEHGRRAAYELAVVELASSSSWHVSDAANILNLSGNPEDVWKLKEAYQKQDSGSGSKEAILSAIAHLDSQRGKDILVDLLSTETEPLRRRQMVELLKKAGETDQILAYRLFARAVQPDGRVELTVASAMLELGDRSLLPYLRTEVQRVLEGSEEEDFLRMSKVIGLLGQAGDNEAVQILGSIALSSTSNPLRREALKALEAIGTPEARVLLDSAR